jgi:hypothetical protein
MSVLCVLFSRSFVSDYETNKDVIIVHSRNWMRVSPAVTASLLMFGHSIEPKLQLMHNNQCTAASVQSMEPEFARVSTAREAEIVLSEFRFWCRSVTAGVVYVIRYIISDGCRDPEILGVDRKHICSYFLVQVHLFGTHFRLLSQTIF